VAVHAGEAAGLADGPGARDAVAAEPPQPASRTAAHTRANGPRTERRPDRGNRVIDRFYGPGHLPHGSLAGGDAN
jgi:hypothetical protein